MAKSPFNENLNSYEEYTVHAQVSAYKRGNVVTVIFTEARTTSTSARTTFGTLPSGWEPKQTVYSGNISGNIGYVCVTEYGQCQGFRPTTDRVDGYVTYVV